MKSYRAYPSYQKGLEWTGNIPRAWRIGRIKDFTELQNGYPFDSSLFDSSGGIPLVRIRDLLKGRTETYYLGEPVSHAWIDEGDILVGMDGDYNVCWWDSGPALLNQRIACLRATGELDQRYFFYSLPFPLKILNDLTYYTTVKHLSSDEIRRIRIPVPAKEEQRQISTFLDNETACIDRLIHKQQRLIEVLDEKRYAVISYAVTKGLNPDVPMKDSGVTWLGVFPRHWNVYRAKTFIREVDDRSSDGNEELLTVSHKTGITPRSEKVVYMIEAESLKGYKKVREGDFVVNTMWAWMGAMGVSGYEGVVSPSYNVYRTIKASVTYPRYYDDLLRIPAFVAEVTRHSRGVWESRLRIYPEQFLNIRMPVPPVKEQEQISRALREKCKSIGRLIEKAHALSNCLIERKSALISAAVTGKIDVRNWKPPESANEMEEREHEMLEAAEEQARYG